MVIHKDPDLRRPLLRIIDLPSGMNPGRPSRHHTQKDRGKGIKKES
jgi:hypothetical protein